MKNNKSGQTGVGIIIVLTVLFGAILLVGGCSLTTIDAGEIGVRTQFGKVTENSVEPGLHFVNPVGGHIVKYDVREQKTEIKAPTYTKDMQQADIFIVVTYALNRSDVGIVHQTFGRTYADKVVIPKVIGAVKDVIGNIEAAELINAREKAAKSIMDTAISQINEAKVPVTITSLVLANIDYSDIFEKSIEEKVIAQQNAIRAQNETKRVEEESKQTVIRAEAQAKSKLAIAKAEAEAVQIRGKALKENPDVVMLEAIGKWDGKTPTTLFLGNGGGMNAVLDVGNFLK